MKFKQIFKNINPYNLRIKKWYYRTYFFPNLETFSVDFQPFHRLSQRLPQRLLEGAVVRAAGGEPVPAEGPRRSAAADYRGAAQEGGGGARRAWTEAPILLQDHAGRK